MWRQLWVSQSKSQPDNIQQMIVVFANDGDDVDDNRHSRLPVLDDFINHSMKCLPIDYRHQKDKS